MSMMDLKTMATLSSSVTSMDRAATMLSDSADISSADAWRRSRLRAAMVTLAPLFANIRAMPLPMPVPPPVTSTIFPSSDSALTGIPPICEFA